MTPTKRAADTSRTPRSSAAPRRGLAGSCAAAAPRRGLAGLRTVVPGLGAMMLAALAGCSSSDFGDCAKSNSCDDGIGGEGEAGTGGSVQGGSGSESTAGMGGASTGGEGATSPSGGVGGTGGAPAVCDPASAPSDDACVIDEQYGVFASPAGDDSTADGSRSFPYATLAAALTAAKSSGKRVYACSNGGTFTEALTIGADLDGSALYGAFDCTSWTYHASARTPVNAPTPLAITISGLQAGLLIENFDVTASAATTAGGSSTAIFVTGSQGVVIRRSHVTAGNGASGANGTNGTNGASGSDPGVVQNGKNTLCGGTGTQTGATAASASSCGSRGGDGGGSVMQAGNPPPPAGTGGTGAPLNSLVLAAGAGGLGRRIVGFGTTSSQTLPAEPGHPGSDGLAGDLANAAATFGVFAENGFRPAGGSAGTDGFTGQGGGGGGGSWGTGTSGTTVCKGPTGGAGGMGGCAGTRGTAGGGGGASVGVFAWFSSVTLDRTVVTSASGGAGGNGGNGGDGGDGKLGGTGGAGTNGLSAAGGGGKGGNGGDGGSGSAGTGGPTIAVVYHGAAPTLNGSTLSTGDGGAPGAGGSVNARTAPDGSAGQSATLFEQK